MTTDPSGRWDWHPAAGLALSAMVMVTLFAWAREHRILEGLESIEWLSRLWMLGTLLLAIGGVLLVCRVTAKSPWVRGVPLCLFAGLVFANGYFGEWFGEYYRTMWSMLDPLFMAFGTAAAYAVVSGRLPVTSHRPLAVGVALILAALVIVVIVNVFFLRMGEIFRTTNPLAMMTALTLAAYYFSSKGQPDPNPGGP